MAYPIRVRKLFNKLWRSMAPNIRSAVHELVEGVRDAEDPVFPEFDASEQERPPVWVEKFLELLNYGFDCDCINLMVATYCYKHGLDPFIIDKSIMENFERVSRTAS